MGRRKKSRREGKTKKKMEGKGKGRGGKGNENVATRKKKKETCFCRQILLYLVFNTAKYGISFYAIFTLYT